MIGPKSDDEYDLPTMVAKPLHFGMFLNVIAPAGVLFLCYYIHNTYYPSNHIPELANTLFYVFAFLAVCQAGAALWLRNRRFREPMIRRQETFEDDMIREIAARAKAPFLLIAAISLWGYLYFFLTGRFQETAGFVLMSFIVFQVVRPRYGSIRKLVEYQQQLVEQGQFAKSSLL
jgi:hypothetical protein